MQNLLLTLPAAVLPGLLLLWFFYRRDVNPEPAGVLFMTFFLGVLIVVPVLIVALPVLFLVMPAIVVAFEGDAGPFAVSLGMAFLTAALPEEFFKFLVVNLYSARHKEFDEPMDGIVYGAAASLGFATMENVVYVLQGGWVLALGRAFTAVPCHAFLGAILGYYVGQARFRAEERGRLLLTGLGLAVLLHGLYDFPLLALNALGEKWIQDNGLLALVLVVVPLGLLIGMGIWTLVLVQTVRAQQLLLKQAEGEIVG